PVDLSQRLELRDASGSTLGYYVPAKEFESCFAGNKEGPEKWERLYKELKEDHERLHKEMSRLRAERDQYLKSLYALIPSQFTFSEEELAELEKSGVTFDALLETIKRRPGE